MNSLKYDEEKARVMDLEDQPNTFNFDRIPEMRENLGTEVLAVLFYRFLKEGVF